MTVIALRASWRTTLARRNDGPPAPPRADCDRCCCAVLHSPLDAGYHGCSQRWLVAMNGIEVIIILAADGKTKKRRPRYQMAPGFLVSWHITSGAEPLCASVQGFLAQNPVCYLVKLSPQWCGNCSLPGIAVCDRLIDRIRSFTRNASGHEVGVVVGGLTTAAHHYQSGPGLRSWCPDCEETTCPSTFHVYWTCKRFDDLRLLQCPHRDQLLGRLGWSSDGPNPPLIKQLASIRSVHACLAKQRRKKGQGETVPAAAAAAADADE